ncbi:unnamed protein product [Adineta ricciae]|uniref:F-box domain-containing protein n=1 Tax=Adineta ricciae TaxID=249248 RepID=A0A815H8N3_ADIRI|nr:unnamed protein product [Adineta ricciae]
MQQAKRRRIENNSKEIRIPTRFDDLSNEIICEVFEYLDAYDVYTSFLNLNIRFQNLVLHSNFPLRIDMFLVSNRSFHRYYTRFLLRRLHRIHSLCLLNSFPMALIILLLQNTSKFTRLRYLLLDQIELVYLENLLLALTTISSLSSLNIIYNGSESGKSNIYDLIFRLPMLKYCKMTFKTGFDANLPPADNNSFSPIKYLYLKGECKLNILSSILSYTSQLRYLSVDTLDADASDPSEILSVASNYLLRASISLGKIQPEQLLSFMSRHFTHLNMLQLSKSANNLDVYQWKALIFSHTPHLRIVISHH